MVLEFVLARNGYGIAGDDGSFSEMLQGVISFTVEQEDIGKWLRAHTQKNGAGLKTMSPGFSGDGISWPEYL